MTRSPELDLLTLDEPCPLCDHSPAAQLQRSAGRSFWRCGNCALIFVAAKERPDAAAEKARYDLHENDPEDPRYQRHLAPLFEAILRATRPGARGLDFGCGPGSALAAMLRRAGRDVALFDPYYAPDEGAWSRTYDFIVASEVFEHIHHPARELERLYRALQPGGVLGVMTKFVPESSEELAAWAYLRDPTHVCFYGRRVFDYIARRWEFGATFPAGNVVLFARSPLNASPVGTDILERQGV